MARIFRVVVAIGVALLMVGAAPLPPAGHQVRQELADPNWPDGG